MIASRSRNGNSWLLRAAFFIVGLVLIGFVPFFGRATGEACSPSLFTLPCFGWSAAALAAFAIGISLIYLSLAFRHPWQRLQRWFIDGDGGLFLVILICALGFGRVAYLMTDLVVEYCWQKPALFACLSSGAVDGILWIITVGFIALLLVVVVRRIRKLFGHRWPFRSEDDEY